MRNAVRRKILAAVGLLSGTALVPAFFQGQLPFKDTPSGPHALHGDVLPPFGMVDPDGKFHPTPHDVPPGFRTGPNRPPESTAKGPSLKLAIEAAQAALNACSEDGYRVGVAVIDSVGEAKVLINGDGTDGSHGFVAMRKAEAARVFDMTSSDANEQVQKDKSLLKRVTPSMLLDAGALPLTVRGELIGAIGVSGAAGKVIGEEDEKCARVGARVITLKLK